MAKRITKYQMLKEAIILIYDNILTYEKRIMYVKYFDHLRSYNIIIEEMSKHDDALKVASEANKRIFWSLVDRDIIEDFYENIKHLLE